MGEILNFLSSLCLNSYITFIEFRILQEYSIAFLPHHENHWKKAKIFTHFSLINILKKNPLN